MVVKITTIENNTYLFKQHIKAILDTGDEMTFIFNKRVIPINKACIKEIEVKL